MSYSVTLIFVKVKVAQSCPTLCYHMDCTCTVHGIVQVRILEWVAAAAAKSLQSCPTLCDPVDSQPTRLLRPWDFPGKSIGVGCHRQNIK